MGIRITWTDTNTAEDGYNVYRSLTSMAGLDPSQLPTPLAELPADATEYKDGTAVDGETYFYLVATRSGSVIVPGTEVEVTAAESTGGGGEDFSTAQIGDEIGGGIYAGTITYGDGRQYHIVAAKKDGESSGLQWGNKGTVTGATDPDDGVANSELILADFDNNDSDAFYHCRDYAGGGFNDWYTPSKNECALIGSNLINTAHPEFNSGSGIIWASTEHTSANAWYVRLTNGTMGNSTSKDSPVPFARPVRRVAVEPDYSTAQIGDEIGGGIYGGTHTNGTETWHLIFAKQTGEAAKGPEWGNYGTTTGANDPDDGLANQVEILTNHDDGSAEAFYHCRDYVDAEGNNDYYLPALNEAALAVPLASMSHAEFTTDATSYRWTSTEDSATDAWRLRFSDGHDYAVSKAGYVQKIRPARRVPV